LSEKFIEKYSDKVNWVLISKYQKLSEKFIEKYKDKVNWKYISEHQKLSKSFIEKHKDKLNLDLIEHSWHYKTEEEKKKEILKTGLYECYNDYFIAYKAVRRDRLSLFNCQYIYKKGKIYKTFADVSSNENSFGFGCGTLDYAKEYGRDILSMSNIKIIKVKIYYKDVARIVYNGEKIRAFKITILN